MLTNISILALKQSEIYPHLPTLAKLRCDLRDPSFEKKRTLNEEKEYLHSCAQSPSSLFVLVLDGPTLVGAALGIALKEVQLTDLPIFSDYFYMERPQLCPHYEGIGLAHHFFDLMEKHAATQGSYNYLCFCEEKELSVDKTLNNHAFWHKRGYIKKELLKAPNDQTDNRGEIINLWVYKLPQKLELEPDELFEYN